MSFQYLFCDLYVPINVIFPWFLCMSYYYLSCFFKYFSCDKYLFCIFLIFITDEFLSHFMHQLQNVSCIFLCTRDKYLSRDFFLYLFVINICLVFYYSSLINISSFNKTNNYLLCIAFISMSNCFWAYFFYNIYRRHIFVSFINEIHCF